MAAPPKIICIGLNYHDHALEQGAELPKEPLLFGKFASALIGPDEAIVLPPESTHVDAEAELAVVIGAEGRRVSEADALGIVAGYTVANDVTARDLQKGDGQWLRAKGFDTFCPLLPGVVPVSELGEGSGSPDRAAPERRGATGLLHLRAHLRVSRPLPSDPRGEATQTRLRRSRVRLPHPRARAAPGRM